MKILNPFLLGAAFASLPLLAQNSTLTDAQTSGTGARVPSLEPLQAGSLHNFHRFDENVLGGSSPETPGDFAALAKLGVKIVVSVDGLRPNVEEAAKHGLTYAHVPFGYDGVPESARLQLIKTFRSASGPIYVHCHHGKHRGPAAIGCMLAGDGRVSAEDAVNMLKAAGTSPDYPGLFRDVAEIQPVSNERLAAVAMPPPAAAVSDFTSAMAQIDRTYDHLVLIQNGGWKPDPSHPDIVPHREALMMHELLFEIGRTDLAAELDLDAAQAGDFRQLLDEGASLAKELERELQTELPIPVLDRRMNALNQNCAACHKRFRN
jgi:protein tyrosine phosphatase (PTP) superfamily phosphohydrolase (DUF442 family)